MSSPTDIRKGRVVIYQNAPHVVLEMMHRTQGRQAGFVQATLRNLKTGTSVNVKFRSTDNVEFCRTDVLKLEFSYVDDEGYHFVDPETFADTTLSKSLVEDQKGYLVSNGTYDVLCVEDKPVQIQLPAAVEMEVTEAPEAIRGDTASNVLKPVTTETGMSVQVPLFIKAGDRIRVSTSNGTYLGRA